MNQELSEKSINLDLYYPKNSIWKLTLLPQTTFIASTKLNRESPKTPISPISLSSLDLRE